MAPTGYVTDDQVTALASKINAGLGARPKALKVNGRTVVPDATGVADLGVITSHVDAAKWGVIADGTTDQRPKLLQMLTDLHRDVIDPTVDMQIRVHLPGGGHVATDGLPYADQIVWTDGHVVPPSTGLTRHMIYPHNLPDWQTDKTGRAPRRAGLENITIDGRRGEVPGLYIKARPQGLKATAATGGTLPVGDTLGYQVGYRTAYGYGQPSDTVHKWDGWAASAVKLEWTNVGGSTDAEVVIWGRHPWEPSLRTVVAILPKGTTSWTDTGSATTVVDRPAWDFDLSTSSCVLLGPSHQLTNVKITEIEGSGLVSVWRTPSGSVDGEPWYSGMEAQINHLRIEGANGPGFTWAGPHDSHMADAFIAGTGGGGAGGDLRDAVNVAEGGPLQITQCHVWGSHRYGFNLQGPCNLVGGSSEGAYDAQISVMSSEVTISGGTDVFYPKTPTSIGIQVGRPATGSMDSDRAGIPVQISDVMLRNFGEPGQAAVDLTCAGRGYVKGAITGCNDTPVRGFRAGDHAAELVNLSGGAHYIKRLPETA